MLMELIANGDLDMKNLNKLKKEQLNQTLLTIGLEKGEIGRFFVFSNVIYYIEIYIRFPSNLARCDVIMTLYKSIQSGYSQCHATGNRKKASGGWYWV